MTDRLLAQNLTRGTTLAEAGRIADTASLRMTGLLEDTHLDAGDGLWIVPCNSIHSFWMKFVFDAVFLDRKQRVVHLYPEMKPWRISRIVWRAHSVLELPAGRIRETGTMRGDQLELKRINPGNVISSDKDEIDF